MARIIARPPPTGWQDLVARPINSGGLGFELLRNLDCRALTSAALDSASRSVIHAMEQDSEQGLDPQLPYKLY